MVARRVMMMAVRVVVVGVRADRAGGQQGDRQDGGEDTVHRRSSLGARNALREHIAEST